MAVLQEEQKDLGISVSGLPEKDQSITEIMVEALKKMSEGERTSTAQLYHRLFPDAPVKDSLDMMEIHYDLEKAAKKAGIKLDDSSHRGKEEGMPYNLDYAVKKLKPAKKKTK